MNYSEIMTAKQVAAYTGFFLMVGMAMGETMRPRNKNPRSIWKRGRILECRPGFARPGRHQQGFEKPQSQSRKEALRG